MSEIFTASNGRKVEEAKHHVGGLRVSGFVWVDLSNEQTQALRENFLAERDKELGRWRDPEDKTTVVYPRRTEIIVTDEEKGVYSTWTRGRAAQTINSDCEGYVTARRYFDAQDKVKAWHDAGPGEWWEITFNGTTHKALVDLEKDFSYRAEGSWGAEYIHRESPRITAGRKL